MVRSLFGSVYKETALTKFTFYKQIKTQSTQTLRSIIYVVDHTNETISPKGYEMAAMTTWWCCRYHSPNFFTSRCH